MAIRQRTVAPLPVRKVLLVLDQFEQWLHAHRGDENTELVNALRQCDGEHLQAVVLVRDDFWMAATRFMGNWKSIAEGARTPLRRSLRPSPCPQGTGSLRDRLRELAGSNGGDQTGTSMPFCDQAITELAQDGKVISVRLALFAEMVKGKPWTPATLRQVGGTEGVGVTFLEETFSSPQANPKHRLHQKAAQAVLKSLLPETGTDIKGQMRSEEDLREAAAYSDRPRDFADLMHILDGELRLITPTDPEESDDALTLFPGGRFYQLTHDYLVYPLADWLNRKQRETRRGRAELVLEARYALWKQKRERRYLPTLTEAVAIILFVGFARLQTGRKKMVKSALIDGSFYVLRNLVIATIVSILIFALLIYVDISSSRGNNLLNNPRKPPNDRVAWSIIMVITVCGVISFFWVLYTLVFRIAYGILCRIFLTTKG